MRAEPALAICNARIRSRGYMIAATQKEAAKMAVMSFRLEGALEAAAAITIEEEDWRGSFLAEDCWDDEEEAIRCF